MSPRERRQVRALARLRDDTGAYLTTHAENRRRELGYSEDDIHRCIANPEQTYPCLPRYGSNRRMYQRADLSLVLHEDTRAVITVLLRGTERWNHGTDTRRTASR